MRDKQSRKQLWRLAKSELIRQIGLLQTAIEDTVTSTAQRAQDGPSQRETQTTPTATPVSAASTEQTGNQDLPATNELSQMGSLLQRAYIITLNEATGLRSCVCVKDLPSRAVTGKLVQRDFEAWCSKLKSHIITGQEYSIQGGNPPCVVVDVETWMSVVYMSIEDITLASPDYSPTKSFQVHFTVSPVQVPVNHNGVAGNDQSRKRARFQGSEAPRQQGHGSTQEPGKSTSTSSDSDEDDVLLPQKRRRMANMTAC